MKIKGREILTTQEIVNRFESLKKQLFKLREEMSKEDLTSSRFRYFSDQAEDIQSQIHDLLFTKWVRILPGDLGEEGEMGVDEIFKDLKGD
jgi:hypothetical protein